MDILDMLAERKIDEANAEGKLDNLPGKGKPLVLDDNPLVPVEMRAMYKMLKEAGILPGWMQQAKETSTMDQEIEQLETRLYREHAHWAEELILIPSASLLDRARRWHADARQRFVELVQRRGQLFRAYDAAAPRSANRSNARSCEDAIRRFDKLFPQFA